MVKDIFKRKKSFKVISNNEIAMNRLWLYDEKGESVGEVNFVIKEDFARKAYDAYFAKQQYTDFDGTVIKIFKSFEEFMNTYTPEKDGSDMYLIALENDAIIEEYVTVDRTEYHLSYDLI